MSFKGICIHHKASGRYATGHKRCKVYDLFIKWNGLFCPCCGYKLRTRATILKLKAKLREEGAIEEAKKIRILYICLKKKT